MTYEEKFYSGDYVMCSQCDDLFKEDELTEVDDYNWFCQDCVNQLKSEGIILQDEASMELYFN